MAKYAHVIIRKHDPSYIPGLIGAIKKENICCVVEDCNHVVLGRYATNKKNLQKVLKDLD